MSSDPDVMAKLDELAAAIGGYDDPRRASTEWKQVYNLLGKTDVPPGRVTGVVGMRDVPGLSEILDQLRSPEPESPAPPGDAPSPEDCKRAMRAFRKRLALTVLDEESTLGRSPLTKGANPDAAAMVPPKEWPDSVWQELVRQGKLRYIGHGFYARTKT